MSGSSSGILPSEQTVFHCRPCFAGQRFFFSSRYEDAALGSGPAVIRGVVHDQLIYGGALGFRDVGVPFEIPPGVPSNNVISVTAPFFFGATLIGFTPSSEPILFTGLTGQGIARLELTYDAFSGGYNFNNITYTFMPVPEPATLLLLGTGLAAVGAAVRKKKK